MATNAIDSVDRPGVYLMSFLIFVEKIHEEINGSITHMRRFNNTGLR